MQQILRTFKHQTHFSRTFKAFNFLFLNSRVFRDFQGAYKPFLMARNVNKV